MELMTKVANSRLPLSDLYDFLMQIENYEKLMPENTQSFRLHESGKGFFVRIGSMPEVGMKQKSTLPQTQIVFESPSENFSYTLTINLTQTEDGSTAQMLFEGSFNPMIEMMAKKPLQNFVDTMAEKIEKL